MGGGGDGLVKWMVVLSGLGKRLVNLMPFSINLPHGGSRGRWQY